MSFKARVIIISTLTGAAIIGAAAMLIHGSVNLPPEVLSGLGVGATLSVSSQLLLWKDAR